MASLGSHTPLRFWKALDPFPVKVYIEHFPYNFRLSQIPRSPSRDHLGPQIRNQIRSGESGTQKGVERQINVAGCRVM